MYVSKRERYGFDTARFILYILQNHGRKCGSWLSTKRTWKYEALQKRDACSRGEITPEELVEWMEAFPNRKKREE